jgi:hypothetical protein
MAAVAALRASPAIRTSAASIHGGTPSSPALTIFRINTYKSATKQTTLTIIKINTYEKQGVGGVLIPSNLKDYLK